jgi:hypothetical protein
MANHSISASLRYRFPGQPSATIRQLAGRYPTTPPGSLRALLGQAGPFQADADSLRGSPRDAFRFTNSALPLSDEEVRILRERLSREVEAAKLIGITALHQSLSAVRIDVPLIPTFSLPSIVAGEVIRRITEPLTNKILETIVGGSPFDYARCGGFAFSGLDYFLNGEDVTDAMSPAPELMRYIWERLLDSLDQNGTEILEWTMQLHVLPVISTLASAAIGAAAGATVGGPIGAAIGSFMAGKADILGVGGKDVLVERTREELNKLRGRLDAGPAWPIGLVYDDKPFVWDQHQLLALRYQDLGGGKLQIYIWDNNDGRQETLWIVDPTGEELQVTSSQNRDGHVKGILCEEYTRHIPPLVA